MTRSGLALQTAYAVTAFLLLAFGGIAGPRARTGIAAAGGAGVAAGALMYVALARGRARPPSRLAAAVAGAPVEEVVWRWGALAGTAPLLGWPAAFAASTVAFAGRHARGRDALPYLVLGATFGGVFLATGRLVAPVAAHVSYNFLAIAAGRR